MFRVADEDDEEDEVAHRCTQPLSVGVAAHGQDLQNILFSAAWVSTGKSAFGLRAV